MTPLLLAASVTPLRDGGSRLDEDAIEPLARFLVAGGPDGIFALGTTGEGVLLSLPERRTAAERFREARAGILIVHCGAQSTADTTSLAAHAASIGADGVAVIPPPYYPLGDDALVEHFVAAASACAPTPFYLYAFAARSGYPLPVSVIERVRERAENIAGLKVSEAPFERVEPYLGLGLPVLVGAERLIPEALAAGAAGAVSGLASGFPQEVAAVVASPGPDGGARLAALRAAVERFPFQAALKQAVRARGVPIRGDVRAPLRPLSPDQVAAVDELVAESGTAADGRAAPVR
jgi:4-hydroxy-tetrahydrodipicolinate synthase